MQTHGHIWLKFLQVMNHPSKLWGRISVSHSNRPPCIILHWMGPLWKNNKPNLIQKKKKEKKKLNTPHAKFWNSRRPFQQPRACKYNLVAIYGELNSPKRFLQSSGNIRKHTQSQCVTHIIAAKLMVSNHLQSDVNASIFLLFYLTHQKCYRAEQRRWPPVYNTKKISDCTDRLKYVIDIKNIKSHRQRQRSTIC